MTSLGVDGTILQILHISIFLQMSCFSLGYMFAVCLSQMWEIRQSKFNKGYLIFSDHVTVSLMFSQGSIYSVHTAKCANTQM